MNLGFFFSRNMSVKLWEELGLLDREKLIYEKHLEEKHLDKIYWFTYGLDSDQYINSLNSKIKVVNMPKIFNSKVGKFLYSFLLPIVQKKYIQDCDILKTDQIDGSWSAVISKLFYDKKLIIRTGFTLSVFMKQKRLPIKEVLSVLIEKFAYKFADFSTVSSQDSLEYIKFRYKIDDRKIDKLNNYIDTTKFKILSTEIKVNKFIFIGRLEEQKNIFNLLNAVEKLQLHLDIYGNGSLQKELEKIVSKNNLNVSFKGKVKNSEFPKILNQYKYYILPSYFEGMPKTLLEAMSCGVCCIGTNTVGINEVLVDNENGYLIDGFESEDIIKKLEYVLTQDNKKICNNAVATIKEEFSLETYSNKENNIFKRLINE